MFDFVRKHTRLMQLLLFVLIVPSFVLFGLEGYNRMQERGETVARVDGRDIKKSDWDEAHKREVDRLRQQMPNLDAAMLDSAEARYATLERIVRDRVLDAAAADAKLTATDSRVAREIQQQNEVLQSLRGPDGRVDMAKYRQMLAQQGLTPEMFEAQVRSELSARQVLSGLGGTGFALPANASVALGAYFERREVQVQPFSSADYKAKVNPTDADIEAFYKANPQLFQAPEQAAIEYAVLDLDSVQKTIAVNEQDLKSYFDQNAARWAGKEERRASHILIASPKSASPEERQKARAKAEELLAQVKKNPASFAELAKKHSQDPGSAAQGGDLDWFGRGAMVKPFEDAVFAMKPGEISNVVESDFGFHVIQVTDMKAAKPKTFEEMRPQLEADVRKQQAQRKYAEAAEQFSNGVYEQSDALKPIADKLKLEVKTATITRQPAQGATGPLANPKFLNAIFAPDSTEKKRNTEAMEVGPNQMVSGRVTQYMPARTRPLAEVKDQVRERLVAQRAAELAKKDGQEKLAAWKAQPATATLPPAVVVSREDAQPKQPRPVIDAALRADPAALPVLVGVDLGPDGYAVVKVNKVIPREARPAPVAKQEAAQFGRVFSSAENLAYYEMLKERFKVEINVPKPAGSSLTQ
jgi:peptidyl-prolyl cis-trans isomerase D